MNSIGTGAVHSATAILPLPDRIGDMNIALDTVESTRDGVLETTGRSAAARQVTSLGTPVAYTLAPVAIAFTCAVATGLVFGFAPAMKAAHLDPVVALASE